MLNLFSRTGHFKIPVKAYRSHGNEFLICVTDFSSKTKWEDIYADRICILNTRPTKSIVQDLQYLLELNGYVDVILVEVVV